MRTIMRKMKDLEQDNRGLTLIELIIAIAILAIVSAPLLHSFLSSAKTGVKSQKLDEVTTIAQEIMENMQGTDYNDIIVDDASSLNSMLCGDAQYYSYDGTSYSNPTTSKPSTEEFHIGVTGITMNGREYKAMIDIEPYPVNGAAAVENYAAINEEMLSEYSAMNAVFRVPKNTEKSDRVITMTVKREGTGTSDDKLVIDVKYEVTVTVPAAEEGGSETTEVKEFYITEEESPYEVQISDGVMPNIYLLYSPNYMKDGSILIYNDKIVIENEQDLDFDLFLIKTMDEEETMSLTELDAAELDYQCQVEQHVTGYYSSTNKIGADIYTNLNERLTYTLGHAQYSNMTSGFIEYDYICGGSTRVAGEFGDKESTLETPNAVVSQTQDERIYRLEMRIYESANTTFQGDALCVMTSSLLK